MVLPQPVSASALPDRVTVWHPRYALASPAAAPPRLSSQGVVPRGTPEHSRGPATERSLAPARMVFRRRWYVCSCWRTLEAVAR